MASPPFIPLEVRAYLGASDAAACVMATMRKDFQVWQRVHNAVVKKTGIRSSTIVDANPQKRGQQKAVINLHSGPSDGPAQLAAKIAVMCVQKGTGALYLEQFTAIFGLTLGPNGPVR